MEEGDFAEVHALWMQINGFAIRSIDDSKEGDPFSAGTMADRDASIMSAWQRATASTASEKPWQRPVCGVCRRKASIRSLW